MENFEEVKEIGSGNFGVARLMKNKKTHELVAVKYIERGPKVRKFGFKHCILVMGRILWLKFIHPIVLKRFFLVIALLHVD